MCYIGVTHKTIECRWQDHLKGARGKKGIRKLYDAIADFGRLNFKIEAMATTGSRKDALRLEIEFIAKLDSTNTGYNVNSGGCGTLAPLSQLTKAKISASQKGKVMSPGSRSKMSEAKLGHKECANNFGSYTGKGAASPLSRSFLIGFPDGTEHVICGLRAFCREHKLVQCKLYKFGKTKGYRLIRRLNDYPEREYTQAGGNGGGPISIGS